MKSFKRIWMTFIIMILSVAMVIGTMSFTAFGLDVGTSGTFVQGINIVSKVVYGKDFDVPAGSANTTVKVTAPNGQVVTDAAGKVTANQVGTYVVSYTQMSGDKEYSYDFEVYSFVEEEYTIKVDLNGADIPTYTQQGTEFTLPKASLVYYDEDGKEIVNEEVTVYTVTTLDAVPHAADGTVKVTPATSGNLYVTYYANMGGENGSKYYSKEFTVKVQSTFTDNTAPTLNVVNVPTDASLNTKVTLPIATATDDFDENIGITVTVKLGDEDVVDVDVDENGYAVVKENAAKINFDNDKVMSFYPTKDGKYTVTYQAKDDSGKVSAEHGYTINCSDTSRPVFKSIDDYQIPANWGLSVVNNSDEAKNDNATVRNAKISFPTPTMVDNAGTEGLTVAFKILDPESNTVISFNNILATDHESSDYTYEGTATTYGTAGTIYKFSDEFDFSEVKTGSTTGDFTVEYRAKDSKGNVSVKTYPITVTNSYEDSEKPTDATIVDAPSYLVIAPDQDTFTVPVIEVSDRGDSRPNSVYELISEKEPNSKLTLKGGEVLDIETVGDATYLVLDDTNRIEIAGGSDITLSLTVTDNAGNTASDTKTISVFSADSGNEALALNTGGLKFKLDAADEQGTDSFKTGGTVDGNGVKQPINIGSFEINVGNPDFRAFTGYELSVKNAAGDGYITDVSSEYYYDTVNNKIVVRNIQFMPLEVGVYQVNIKAFDLSGKNIVAVALINVEKGTNDNTSTTSTVMPNNVSVNVNYTFRNTTIELPGRTGTYFEVHKIKGAKHSVMGTELTVKQAVSYAINDGYAKYNETNNTTEEFENYAGYTITAKDNESPIIEVQGVMPTYSKKSTDESPVTVTLPTVVAFTKNGNGIVDLKVQLTKGGSVNTTYDEATKTYSFQPTKDGQYTIIVVGSVGSATTTQEFYLNCGDVIGPVFTVNNLFDERVSVGKEFTFGTVTATAESHESIEKFTYTKRLIDPSNEVVTEATISGVGSTYANRTVKDSNTKITLSKTGTYEVVYEVTDEVGNVTTFKQTITVTSKTGASSVSIAAISTVLIVVGVVLIAAVIFYFVLFRKRKEKMN